MVWMNDIYLLLAPQYLKKKDLHSNIGFFNQSSFPSSDIFKTFPHRTEILKSLLCSDIIGFHLFEYARNFTAACRKILSLNTVTKKGGFLGVEYNGRTILIKISHIRINIDDVSKNIKSREFSFYREKLVNMLIQPKKFILASVDRIHPISGVRQKLEGYLNFLKNYANFRQKTCLVQILLPPECENFGAEDQKKSISSPAKKDKRWSRGREELKLHDNWTKEMNKKTMDDIKVIVD